MEARREADSKACKYEGGRERERGESAESTAEGASADR